MASEVGTLEVDVDGISVIVRDPQTDFMVIYQKQAFFGRLTAILKHRYGFLFFAIGLTCSLCPYKRHLCGFLSALRRLISGVLAVPILAISIRPATAVRAGLPHSPAPHFAVSYAVISQEGVTFLGLPS